jgi:hypothetical protein
MADRNAILKEMTALRRDDFARYKAEIIDNIRVWHGHVRADINFGTMWGIIVIASSGRITSADVLRAVCERAMPPCFSYVVRERGDKAFLRITGYDAALSPVPPYYQPRNYPKNKARSRERPLWRS